MIDPAGDRHPQLDVVGERRAQPAGNRVANILGVGVRELEADQHLAVRHQRHDSERFGRRGHRPEQRHPYDTPDAEPSHHLRLTRGQYLSTSAMFARQKESFAASPSMVIAGSADSPEIDRKYRRSQATPTRSLKNPVAPPPTFMAASVSLIENKPETGGRPSTLRRRMTPAPPTKYGRSGTGRPGAASRRSRSR